MVRCKLIVDGSEESMCGKDLCCHYCPDKDTCTVSCDETGQCPEQLVEQDALQVMQDLIPEKITEVTDLMIMVKKAEDRIAEIKESLLKAMEEHGVKKFENEYISFTYVAPSVRKTFDKKKLEKDHPEIDLDQYQKESKVKASVRIQVK